MPHDLDSARQKLRSAWCRDEADAVAGLLALAPDKAARGVISGRAKMIVERGRKLASGAGALDAFLQEFDLANHEGVVLMCLAEALLRIPDGGRQPRSVPAIKCQPHSISCTL